MEPSKKDWKFYREEVPGWQEHYMERILEEAVIKKYLITASDGKSYNTKHYNLQAII